MRQKWCVRIHKEEVETVQILIGRRCRLADGAFETGELRRQAQERSLDRQQRCGSEGRFSANYHRLRWARLGGGALLEDQ